MRLQKSENWRTNFQNERAGRINFVHKPQRTDAQGIKTMHHRGLLIAPNRYNGGPFWPV